MEERGLVKKMELEMARNGQMANRGKRKRNPEDQSEDFITKVLQNVGTTIIKAPNGMSRNLENATTWSKKQRCMNWQVEWIREADAGGRVLSKSIERWPISDIYSAILEDERKKNMTPMEKTAEKKRKAEEMKDRQAKRAKSDGWSIFDISAISISQDPDSGAWKLSSHNPISQPDQGLTCRPQSLSRKLDPKYRFYLHRPKTQSSYPKVLVPVDSAQSLTEVLRNRTVLEFPTIYVFETGPDELPASFMLESAYVKATGDDPFKHFKTETDTEGSADEDTSSSEPSSEEDEDEDMEDGEVVS